MRLILLKPFILLATFFCAMIISIAAYADDWTPVGTWQTIDDATGKSRSIVQIWQNNDELRGRIEKVFYRPGEGPDDVCKKCSGPFHNQPILGMTILWGMVKQSDLAWSGGRILDPHNGKIYRCKMTLGNNGQELTVRGYIGFTFIGRTQTWLRVASPA